MESLRLQEFMSWGVEFEKKACDRRNIVARPAGFGQNSCNRRNPMQIAVHSVADLGLAVRAVRRASDVRLDDFAATAGVSKQFASDVERGKPSVQLGLVLALLSELGIPLVLDIPSFAEPELAALRSKGVRPPRTRTVSASGSVARSTKR